MNHILIKRHILISAICILICGLFLQPVAAHPHSWVELKTHIILDEQNHLTSIKQFWAFDDYFSTVTMADAINEFGSKDAGLTTMAKQFVSNLASYQYFSELTINGNKIELPKPSTYRLFEKYHQQKSVLVLEMRFNISPTLLINDDNMVWSVYDPTYYIAMNHLTTGNISIIGENSGQCLSTLDSPSPSYDLVEYAQALDRSQKDTDGLGINFAEKVRINCSSDISQ